MISTPLMKSHIQKCCIAALALVSLTARADLLLFQSSDNHSEYANIPGYIRVTSDLAQRFWTTNPGEPVIHITNGDFAGPSTATLLHGSTDRGALGFRVFALLHQRYFTIFNSGNHDYDYHGEDGIQLYLRQNHDFLAAANVRAPTSWATTPIRLTTANVEPTAVAHTLYQPHQQLVTPTGKKLWVVGLLLDDFYEYSVYDRAAPTQTIDRLLPMLDTAKAQMLEAAAQGIDAVIFMAHEQFPTVKALLLELQAWQTAEAVTNPALGRVRLPVFFAAHDHKNLFEKVGDTHLIDSHTGYSFSAVRLDDDGELIDRQFHASTEFATHVGPAHLYPEEATAIAEVSAYMNQVSARASEVLRDAQGRPYTTVGFSTVRADMQKHHQELGRLVVDSFVQWASDELAAAGRSHEVRGVLGFYNSGSYRNAHPIAAGSITRVMSIGPYPLSGPAIIRLLTGADVQNMYTALRRFGVTKNDFTPQISSDMREVLSADNSHLLEVRDASGHWALLEPTATYAVTFDMWLGMNGFELPEWRAAMAASATLQPQLLSEANEVLMEYFPRILDTHAQGCAAALQP